MPDDLAGPTEELLWTSLVSLEHSLNASREYIEDVRDLRVRLGWDPEDPNPLSVNPLEWDDAAEVFAAIDRMTKATTTAMATAKGVLQAMPHYGRQIDGKRAL